MIWRIDWGRANHGFLNNALTEWIAIEEERHRLTLEAMQDVRNGQTISHESVFAWVDSLGTDHQFPCPAS